MSQRFIRLPEVANRVGLKRSCIYKLISEGRFPKPIKLGARAAVWPEATIEAWITAQIDRAA